jgi:hypothetical protein
MATLVWKSLSSPFHPQSECDSQCGRRAAVNIQVVGCVVNGYRLEATMMIECEFVFDVYGLFPNDYYLPAID